MAPSLQERFGLRKKKIFDAFDDSSYMTEEVGDLDAPGSAEMYVSSLEPTKEEPEEDKEQAPLPPPPPLTNERAPSVLGRLLGKNPSSPRKSSKNSMQSAPIASTPAMVSEDAPQTPAKLKRKIRKVPKRKSVQCKQSLLDSGSDESLSDDDGYRPSKGMASLKPNRPKVVAADSEVESSLSVGMGEVDKFNNPSSLPGPSLHNDSSQSRGDHKERRNSSSLAGPNLHNESSSQSQGDHKERRKVLAAPSQESLMDMALASQNDPNPSETTSVKPKRRAVRKSNEPQGAQFMPSLVSADADADCESESEVDSGVDDAGYLPTPMGRRPSLLSAPSQSGEFIDDGDSTEDDSSNGAGEEKKDDHNSVIESRSVVPSWNVKNPQVKAYAVKRRGSGRKSKELQQPSSDSVIESQSFAGSSEAADYWNTKKPVVNTSAKTGDSVDESQSVPSPSVANASAKTKRNSGRRPKEPQPTSDPECEGVGSSDEDDDGYLPTAMASSKSSRPAMLPALSQSSLTGDVFDNQSSEPSPHADESQASLDCSLSDLGPDGTNNGDDSAVFSLSALEKKNDSSPAESLLQAERDDSTSKFDNSLQGLSMAFEDQEGSQSNLNLAKLRQNKVKGPEEVDPSVRSIRSSSQRSRPVSPRRQHLQLEHDSPKSPKTSRPSKSQPLHRRSKSSIPIEDVSKPGPSREQISMSQHTPSAPRRKMAKSKGDTRVHPDPPLGGDDVSQTDQGRENKVSTRGDKSEKASASRRQFLRAMTKETGIFEENVSPTSVEGFSPPRRQQRKVTPTTTPKASSSSNHSRNHTPRTTPRVDSASNLFKATTPNPNPSSSLFKATTPNPRSTSSHAKATTPNPRGTSRTTITPRRAQTPRGTSSSRNVDKSSDSFKKLIGQLGSLREDEETSSRSVVPESLQNVKSTKNLNRPSNSERTSSLRHLIAESSPRKTSSSRNLVGDSSRKTSSSKSVNPESSRKANSSRSVNPESPRRQSSSRSVNPESPRRTTSSRNVNPESPRTAASSKNLNLESPRRAASSRNLNPESPQSPRRAASSRNVRTASLQKTGSSRNVKTASPLNAGRDLLKRAQSSRMMANADWNYEPNRRHVTPASGDDPDNRDRDANKTSSRHLRIPTIDIC